MRPFAEPGHDFDTSLQRSLSPAKSETFESFTKYPQQTSVSLNHPVPSFNPPELSFYLEAMLPWPLSPPPLFSPSAPINTPPAQMSRKQHVGMVGSSALPTVTTNDWCMAEPHQHVPSTEHVWFAPQAFWNANFKEEEARSQC